MNHIFSLKTLTSCLILFNACKKEDEPIIDPGEEGINVSDGLYLALSGEDPSSLAQLTDELVDAEGFSAQARDGFIAGYMWLKAGDYSVVQVTNKEITATIGGGSETITGEGSACDHNDYLLVKTEADGAVFNIANSGLYKVTHDQTTNELIAYQIKEVSIIGSILEGNFTTDNKLEGAVTADGGSFKAENLVMRKNKEFKVRFNCSWSISRLIDPTINEPLSDPANGYQLFTNFGGAVNSLESGGSNIKIEEDATYSVTVDWEPRNGWSMKLEKTGDAPVLTFKPEEYQFGIIGDATAKGWEADRNLHYAEIDGAHTWHGVITFAEEGTFKFRINDDWGFSLGGDLASPFVSDDNIQSPGAGAYYIVLTTADEGDTWSTTASEFGWSVIGEGSPSGDWEMDTDLSADGFEDGITTYSFKGDFKAGEWKFRAGHDWAYNLGGSLEELSVGGDNLKNENENEGEYTITLLFDGEKHSAKVE